MRPINIMVAASASLMSAYILENFHYSIIKLYTLLVVVFYTGAANAFNDYCDYEIDLINRPNRPLSRGLLNSNEALFFFNNIIYCWLFSGVITTIKSYDSFCGPSFALDDNI